MERPVVPCKRTDRQTDRQDETNSRFRNYANAPNNRKIRVDFVSWQLGMFPGGNKRDSKCKVRTLK